MQFGAAFDHIAPCICASKHYTIYSAVWQLPSLGVLLFQGGEKMFHMQHWFHGKWGNPKSPPSVPPTIPPIIMPRIELPHAPPIDPRITPLRPPVTPPHAPAQQMSAPGQLIIFPNPEAQGIVKISLFTLATD
jgi:hypothetical protein